MLLLRVSIPFFFLMSTDSFSVHPNPKRNEISWDEANKDLSLDTTTSMLGFNGNDSFAEVRTFERSRDAKSHQLARLSEMGEIGQMRVYNVGVLMASHLGKCGCGAVGSKTDDLAIACRFPLRSRTLWACRGLGLGPDQQGFPAAAQYNSAEEEGKVSASNLSLDFGWDSSIMSIST